jgi:hypothetical protein
MRIARSCWCRSEHARDRRARRRLGAGAPTMAVVGAALGRDGVVWSTFGSCSKREQDQERFEPPFGSCSKREQDQERFEPPFGRPESLLFDSPKRSNQEKGDPIVAPILLRRIGALRYSPLIGRRELAHPCARTSAPFPDQRLRCSARHTGFARHTAFAADALRPAPERGCANRSGLRALRGHDGRVTGPLAGRRAGAAPGPQGRAQGCARVRAAQDALSANSRSPIAHPEAGCRRATGWGALSLAYFSLGKQREVGRDARRAARKLLIWLLSKSNNQSRTTHTGRGHGPLPHPRLALQTHHTTMRHGREHARSCKSTCAQSSRPRGPGHPPPQSPCAPAWRFELPAR